MKRLIEDMFYREGDNGAAGGGTGIPAAPIVTDAPTGDGSATGIPASLPVTDVDIVEAGTTDDDEGGYKFTGRDITEDDIPFRKYGEDDQDAAEPDEADTDLAEGTGDGATKVGAAVEAAVQAEGAIPESVQKALKAAAESLGIDETDPEKLLAAIEAKRNENATGEQKQREDREAAFEQKAIERLQDQANQDVVQLLNPEIKINLLSEGHDVDAAPDGWWDNTSANYDEAMTLRYNQLYNTLRVQPKYQQAYDNSFAGHKAAYDTEKAVITAFTEKYPNHASDLVSDLRQAGATAGFLERIAATTDQAVTKAIAMTHFAIAAKDTELSTLRAQVSGHVEALAQARAEGKAEGQKAALVLAKGQSVPNTVGVNAVAPAPYKYNPNKDLTLDDIPFRTRTHS